MPVEDIRPRYRISLAHLSAAIADADQAVLYDNSARAEVGPRVFAEVEQGVFVALEADRPLWFRTAVHAAEVGDEVRD